MGLKTSLASVTGASFQVRMAAGNGPADRLSEASSDVHRALHSAPSGALSTPSPQITGAGTSLDLGLCIPNQRDAWACSAAWERPLGGAWVPRVCSGGALGALCHRHSRAALRGHCQYEAHT